jgi:hypothetical protein
MTDTAAKIEMPPSPKNQPFQLKKWYWGIRVGGTGAGGGTLGRTTGAFKGTGFGGGGPELHLDFCRPRNYDRTSYEFSGHCWSAGYGSLWNQDGSRTDRVSAAFHLFFWDGQLAIPLGLSFLHRQIPNKQMGADARQLGGDINVGLLYRFLPPFRLRDNGKKHRVLPYLGGQVLLGGFGETNGNAGGFHAGLQLSAGVEFGLF